MKKTSSRALQARKTRRKLFKNAIKLIEKHGFDNVKIEDICKQSKVSVGAFYHYFNSKTEIITELYKQIDSYFETEVADKIKGVNSNDCIVLFFRHFAKFISNNHFYHVRILYGTQNEVLIDKERFMYVLLKEIIDNGKEKKELNDTYNTEFIEDFLLMLARGVILDWILNEGKYDLEEKMWSNISAASPLFAA